MPPWGEDDASFGGEKVVAIGTETMSAAQGLKMFHTIRQITKFVLAIIGSLVFWRLGELLGLAVLTFACGSALAGKGNQLAWTVSFFLIVGALAALLAALSGPLAPPRDSIPMGLLVFGLAPLIPALLLWSAHTVRTRGKPSPHP